MPSIHCGTEENQPDFREVEDDFPFVPPQLSWGTADQEKVIFKEVYQVHGWTDPPLSSPPEKWLFLTITTKKTNLKSFCLGISFILFF